MYQPHNNSHNLGISSCHRQETRNSASLQICRETRGGNVLHDQSSLHDYEIVCVLAIISTPNQSFLVPRLRPIIIIDSPLVLIRTYVAAYNLVIKVLPTCISLIVTITQQHQPQFLNSLVQFLFPIIITG